MNKPIHYLHSLLGLFFLSLIICLIISTLTFSQQQVTPPYEASSSLIPETSFLEPSFIAQVLASDNQNYDWQLPAYFPLPAVPESNPMSEAKVLLGRALFYDTGLSINNSMACASCHHQAKAFSDGERLSLGATGELGVRNAQALVNTAYNGTLTWMNPSLTELERHIPIPLFADFPVEMGMDGSSLLDYLHNHPDYPKLFAHAFPAETLSEEVEPISLGTTVKALASFVRSLLSSNAAYDRFVYADDESALSESQQRGMALFFSERLECHHCHGGFNFTQSTVSANTAFPERPFHNTGLYNIDGKGAYPAPNIGIMSVTLDPEDMGKFRAPSLRNVALTAPYMHDGSIADLEAVIRFYEAGGRLRKFGKHAGDGRRSPFKDGFVAGFHLSEQERDDLIAFLHALTDEDFIHNPAFSNPFRHFD